MSFQLNYFIKKLVFPPPKIHFKSFQIEQKFATIFFHWSLEIFFLFRKVAKMEHRLQNLINSNKNIAPTNILKLVLNTISFVNHVTIILSCESSGSFDLTSNINNPLNDHPAKLWIIIFTLHIHKDIYCRDWSHKISFSLVLSATTTRYFDTGQKYNPRGGAEKIYTNANIFPVSRVGYF